MSYKSKGRSDQEWLQLITDCRRSGFSDKEWCLQQEIPISSFYNAVTRLRKKACSIPVRERETQRLDLTTRSQDVVQIDIVPDRSPEPTVPEKYVPLQTHLDNQHMIEIVFQNGELLRISNGADDVLLEKVITIFGR